MFFCNKCCLFFGVEYFTSLVKYLLPCCFLEFVLFSESYKLLNTNHVKLIYKRVYIFLVHASLRS